MNSTFNFSDTTTAQNTNPVTPAPRKLWLIEGSYLFKCQEHLEAEGLRLDMVKLRKFLERQGKFYSAKYFTATPKECSAKQTGFLTFLHAPSPYGAGFDIEQYNLKAVNCSCPNCSTTFQRHVTGGIDVGIATTALVESQNFDTLVLSSGDCDYMDAVNSLRNKFGKRVELAVFNGSVSSRLACSCDSVIMLDQHLPEITRTWYPDAA